MIRDRAETGPHRVGRAADGLLKDDGY